MVLHSIVRTLKAECRFYFDDEVRNQIFGVIRDAEAWLSLVSPYNKHPQQLRELLSEAIARGVHVTMLYRDEKDQREGVTDLEHLGAKVLPVKWLHSKVYMNESTALASSMNLLDSSFNNSSEFCIRIDKASNGPLYNQLKDYVERIQLRTERRNPSATPAKSTPAKAAAKSAPPRRRAPRAAAASATGHCIRCGDASIAYNRHEPLCPKCFKSWNRFKDRDYPENHCHRCGKEHDTSMAKPLCRTCWQAVVQA